jgi:enamine deaminase RidA (YjgF/YER057c/UK114 family)
MLVSPSKKRADVVWAEVAAAQASKAAVAVRAASERPRYVSRATMYLDVTRISSRPIERDAGRAGAPTVHSRHRCQCEQLVASGAMSDPKPVFSSPDDLAPPAGYSHVVSIPAGRLVWTSGQVPFGPDGAVIADDWEGQTRVAFANVGRALDAAGAGWSDVVKLTIFVVDVSALATIRAVRDELVDTARPPTSSLVQVAALARPELLIEVEAVAWLTG